MRAATAFFSLLSSGGAPVWRADERPAEGPNRPVAVKDPDRSCRAPRCLSMGRVFAAAMAEQGLMARLAAPRSVRTTNGSTWPCRGACRAVSVIAT